MLKAALTAFSSEVSRWASAPSLAASSRLLLLEEMAVTWAPVALANCETHMSQTTSADDTNLHSGTSLIVFEVSENGHTSTKKRGGIDGRDFFRDLNGEMALGLVVIAKAALGVWLAFALKGRQESVLRFGAIVFKLVLAPSTTSARPSLTTETDALPHLVLRLGTSLDNGTDDLVTSDGRTRCFHTNHVDVATAKTSALDFDDDIIIFKLPWGIAVGFEFNFVATLRRVGSPSSELRGNRVGHSQIVDLLWQWNVKVILSSLWMMRGKASR